MKNKNNHKENVKKEAQNLPKSNNYEMIKNQFTLKSAENIIVVIGATILFTITGIWQLIIFAGFIGGFFSLKSKNALIIGFIGVFLGWMILFIFYALTTELLIFFDFWLQETMKIPLTFVYLIMFISSVLGGVVGTLGALNGLFISRIVFKKIASTRSFTDSQ